MRSRADATPRRSSTSAELAAVGGKRMTLSREESHYVAASVAPAPVMRWRATDGRGTGGCSTVVAVASSVRVMVTALEVARLRGRSRLGCCGRPRGRARADWMIEKLAELGVERFVPVGSRSGAVGAIRRATRAVGADRGLGAEAEPECLPPSGHGPDLDRGGDRRPPRGLRSLARVGRGGASKRADGASRRRSARSDPQWFHGRRGERAFADAGFASIPGGGTAS